MFMTLPNGYEMKVWADSRFADVLVPSSTTEGNKYTVHLDVERDFMTCTCKGFWYRSRCKHLAQVRQALAMSETKKVTSSEGRDLSSRSVA